MGNYYCKQLQPDTFLPYLMLRYPFSLEASSSEDFPIAYRGSRICVQFESIWVPQTAFERRFLLFQLSMNFCHILTSSQKPAFNLIWWWGCFTPLVSWIIRCRKGRPGEQPCMQNWVNLLRTVAPVRWWQSVSPCIQLLSDLLNLVWGRRCLH